MKRKGDWIGTYSGRRFWPLDPRAEDVCSLDIAQALSLKVRWTGQCSRLYTIGQHSLRVAAVARVLAGDGKVAETVEAYALLHDASEAYLADLASPLKRNLPWWEPIERAVQDAVHDHYRLPRTNGDPAKTIDVVKRADDILLALEANELFPEPRSEEWNIPAVEVSVEVMEAAHPFSDTSPDVVKLALLDRLLRIEARR